MQRLWPAAEMREWDARTIAAGVPGAALMECAGAAVADAVRELAPPGARVSVLCGPGNNGGDGAVAARRLREAGYAVTLVYPLGVDGQKGDAATMLQAARGVGVSLGEQSDADVIVDALLGTGATGEPRAEIAAAVEAANAAGCPIVAADVPSGVDGSTGEVAGVAIAAAVTVCLGGRKLGVAIEPGRRLAGAVRVAEIGLAPSLAPEPSAWLIEASDLAGLPGRSATGSKYDAGSILVVGGAPGMTGAPALAARAAFRAGAGLVRCAVPASERDVVASLFPEAMVSAASEPDDVLALAERMGAVVLGPGLGREAGAAALVDALVASCEAPLLIDADGLFPLAGRLDVLAGRRGPTALTPHAAELARLLGRETEEVERARLSSVRDAAAQAGCAVLLKGPDTLVAAPGEPLRVVDTAVPALATAGAGDVLSGVCGALLARGLAPAEALALGALAHGLAGAEAHAEHGALMASDLEGPLGRLLG